MEETKKTLHSNCEELQSFLPQVDSVGILVRERIKVTKTIVWHYAPAFAPALFPAQPVAYIAYLMLPLLPLVKQLMFS